MPATSAKQRRFFGFVEHNPEKAKAKGVYPKGMTHDQMHDFAVSKEKGLPATPAPLPRLSVP
jgi:hypothetical protein